MNIWSGWRIAINIAFYSHYSAILFEPSVPHI